MVVVHLVRVDHIVACRRRIHGRRGHKGRLVADHFLIGSICYIHAMLINDGILDRHMIQCSQGLML